MSASSLSLPIFLRINFLISYLIVTDSQNTFDWHTQRALLNDKKAGAGCTSRAFKHPGRDVTAPDVWPSILTDYTYDSELDNADGVPLASRRSSMFPEGNLSSALQKKKKFMRKKHFSCSWALLLKLHLATFSHWERSFWALWPCIPIICLVALNTELVFLEALKKWFCAIKL